MLLRCFNPRSRKGNDRTNRRCRIENVCFNPRSRKGNDFLHLLRPCLIPRFNPRSRKGNDLQKPTLQLPGTVSIHVPARGTTRLFFLQILGYNVSIHVPARGTTNPSSFFAKTRFCFNPRSRKGNDQGSIPPSMFYACFNPRSRKGNDKKGR